MRTNTRKIWIAGLATVASLGATPQNTELIDAARSADVTKVATLLEQRVDVNAAQADGATALHWAAHLDHKGMASALILAGAAVNITNDFGVTPLWLACLNGSATMVKLLLQAGADATAALPSGETTLMTASRSGSAEAVSLLVAYGANPNAQEYSRGQTALMWAVAQRHQAVVKTLVELGADLHIRSTPRPRRIHTRTAGFNPAGVIDVVQGGFTAMLFAARSGDLEIATHLVDGGADIDDTSLLGTSALVVATHSGHTALATFLLERGADPNAADAGYSALHTATLRGDQALVSALLARGADPNVLVQRGSPGRRNSPDYVLEHDVVGATAFWLAARFAEPGIMRVLKDNGATPHLVMSDGTTPLMAATNARRRREPGLAANPVEEERLILEAVRLAIEGGIDLDAADESGNAALHTAASRRLDSVIQLLIESGATMNTENEAGQTPLALAARRNTDDNSTVTLLRRLGAADD